MRSKKARGGCHRVSNLATAAGFGSCFKFTYVDTKAESSLHTNPSNPRATRGSPGAEIVHRPVVPSRVSSNDTKFTLSRIAELEQPILAVSLICTKSCLCRGPAGISVPWSSLSTDDKLQASVAEARDLFFVGFTRAGKLYLYERQASAIRPSPLNGGGGPMRQMSIGAFAGCGASLVSVFLRLVLGVTGVTRVCIC